jgi:hypothetical protein
MSNASLTDREFLEVIKCDIENYLKATVKDPEEKLVRNRHEVLHKMNLLSLAQSHGEPMPDAINIMRWFLFMVNEI